MKSGDRIICKKVRQRNYDREITFNDEWGGILSKDLVRTPIICNFTFRITLKIAILADKRLIEMDLDYDEQNIKSEIRSYYANRDSDVIDNEWYNNELYQILIECIGKHITYVTLTKFNIVSIKKKKKLERRDKLDKINNSK